MWRMVLRDLQWRRRRFLLAGLATALVFAVTLVLTGVSTSVHSESRRVVERFDADAWLVRAGGSGPFTGAASLSPADVDAAAGVPGVERAQPVLLLRGTLPGDVIRDINLIGLPVGGLGAPIPDHGRALEGPGEAVVDVQLGFEPGDALVLGGETLEVAGTTDRISYTFGIPTVFVPLEDAQRIALAGARAVSAVVVQGAPRAVPPGLVAMDDGAVLADLERPLARATDSIDLVRILLTITAAGIIGLIVYLSTLERTSDLAVLKATGSSAAFMVSGLALQALLLSIGAALAAVGMAAALGPMFPVPLEVHGATYAQLLALATVVGLVASLAGVWRAVRVDPVVAFGGG